VSSAKTVYQFKVLPDAKHIVFWISDWHSTFNCYPDLATAEKFRDKLLALEATGGTYRGRTVNHVVLSSR
jgi:hypothetical protein